MVDSRTDTNESRSDLRTVNAVGKKLDQCEILKIALGEVLSEHSDIIKWAEKNPRAVLEQDVVECVKDALAPLDTPSPEHITDKTTSR